MRRRFTGLLRMGRCLRMNRGRRIGSRFSSSGWTRGVRPEAWCGEWTFGGRLLVGDHLAQVGDVLFDSGDVFGPGRHAFVRYSGGVFSFGFGEDVEGVLELLLKCGAGHRARLSPRTPANAPS